MNQKHIPNLELCQEFDRLCKEKNITIPETEYFLGRHSGMDGTWSDYYLYSEKDNHCPDEQIPAPLVSEQGEWLPQRIAKNKGQQVWALQCFKKMHNGKEEWFTRYENVEGTGFLNMQDPTEANARQKLINYLIAEGIITKL